MAASALALACGAPEVARGPAVQRAVDAPGGSTAGFEVVEIDGETRPVLGAQPRIALRWREDIVLGDQVALDVTLPDELADTARVWLEGWVSAWHPDARGLNILELRTLDRRITLRAEPVVVEPRRSGPRVTTAIEVAETLRGLPAQVNVIARPLPDDPRVRFVTRDFELPDGAGLEFGFGLEEDAWQEGWPAVRFRVVAQAGEVAETLYERVIDPVNRPDERRWFDASVDLSGLAEGKARFVFEAEALVAAPGVSVPRSLAVVSHPAVVTRVAGDGRPNIVLVSLDTLRARSMSAYGNSRPTTPVLDERVAAAGALVRQAVVPFPFTPPSHMTMLTGLDPCMHGVRSRFAALPADLLTLAEMLREEGYDTAAFTENAYVTVSSGFARGFDTYVERREDEIAAPGFAAETLADAARWLALPHARPFFLFVHTYQVHAPHRPPPAYRDLFLDGDRHDLPEEQRESLLRYEQEIRYTDDLMDGFLDSLEAAGLGTDTILVVTSDHGEAFREHWATGHGLDAHDEALLVPLLFWSPGRIPAGTVVAEPVALVDLVPTLLELVGLEPPAELSGRSFASSLNSGAAFDGARPLVIDTASKQLAVRTAAYKYIQQEGVADRLYDLERDPLERHNLAASSPDLVSEAREVLRAHRDACDSWGRDHPTPRAVTDPGRSQPAWLVNRDDIDQKLRSLGYAE